jgi:hypothetical protein
MLQPNRILKTFVIGSLLWALACNPHEPQSRIVSLPSGRQVKILSVGKMYFTKGDPALVLKYQTDLPLENVSALAVEADEIWQAFRVDVDAQHMKNAMISATKVTSTGLLTQTRGYNFVYKKQADGSWRRL